MNETLLTNPQAFNTLPPSKESWVLLDFALTTIKGQCEVALTLRLSAEEAKPLLDEGNRQADELRSRIAGQTRQSDEFKTFTKAEAYLQSLRKEQENLQGIVAGHERELQDGPPPEQLPKLTKVLTDARGLVGTVSAALTSAQTRRDEAAHALHRRAEAIAHRERNDALGEADKQKRAAAGLLGIAAKELGVLVEKGSFAGMVRGGLWSQFAARQIAEQIVAGPLPSIIPSLGAPALPLHPNFGQRPADQPAQDPIRVEANHRAALSVAEQEAKKPLPPDAPLPRGWTPSGAPPAPAPVAAAADPAAFLAAAVPTILRDRAAEREAVTPAAAPTTPSGGRNATSANSEETTDSQAENHLPQN